MLSHDSQLSSRNQPILYRLADIHIALLTVTLILVIYLSTLAPTLFIHDSAELVAGVSSLGIVHSPGYSVYMLVARAFSYIPVGDVAYRVNLLSAVSTLGAIFCLVLLLRQLRVPKVVASITGCLFGLSFYTWSLSVIAEVYTFQVWLLILMLGGAWQWQKTGRLSYLYAVTFLLGLSAANNPSTILWWGGILLLLRLAYPKYRLTWRTAGFAALTFGLGTLFILYLPIRSQANPLVNQAGYFDANAIFHPINLRNPFALLWYITGGPFHRSIGNYTFLQAVSELKTTLLRVNAAFLGIGLPLGLWGLIALWRKKPSIAVAFLLTLLPHLIFFTLYRVPDKETMFLPVYLVWAIFVGLGLSRLRELLPQRTQGVLWVLPIAFFTINRPYINVNNHYALQAQSQIRLESAEPDSIYIGTWSVATGMQYLQTAADIRTDVSVINVFLIAPETQRQMVAIALEAGRAVYIGHQDEALANHYHLSPIAHGFQLEAMPEL